MGFKKVMIVDDEPAIRTNLSQVLSWEGFSTIPAENGKEALAILESLSPEQLPGFIILDLMMPVMDGEEFLTQFKENKSLNGIPIILSTASTREISHEVQRIEKPIDIEQLFSLARKYCE